MNTSKNKKKVAVLIINRANYGRLKPVLQAIQEHPDLELQLIVGSAMLLYRFGDDVRFIEEDGFKISARLNMIIEGGTPMAMAQSTGVALMSLPSILEQLNPDLFLVNGDRFEILPAAMAAAYMNIPLAHTLGGEITGTIDESIRHAVTKLSHIHLTAHKPAADRIVSMGEDPQNVFVVGNPSLDIAKTINDNPNIFNTLKEKINTRGIGKELNLDNPYILAYQHPVTTEHNKSIEQMKQTLQALHDTNIQIIMIWPNPDAGTEGSAKAIRDFREKNPNNKIHFFRSFNTEDYLTLLKNAQCVVGNTSSAIMEGGFFGTPAINIGTRQNGRERCINTIDVGYNYEEIKNAIKKQLDHGKYEQDLFFGDGMSGKRIADILFNTKVSIQKMFNKDKNYHLIKNLIK